MCTNKSFQVLVLNTCGGLVHSLLKPVSKPKAVIESLSTCNRLDKSYRNRLFTITKRQTVNPLAQQCLAFDIHQIATDWRHLLGVITQRNTSQ